MPIFTFNCIILNEYITNLPATFLEAFLWEIVVIVVPAAGIQIAQGLRALLLQFPWASSSFSSLSSF